MPSIEKRILQESEKENYILQNGCYYSGQRVLKHSTLVWSDTIQDTAWNLAGAIDVTEENSSQMLEDVARFLQEKDRLPSVVITPFTKPGNLSEIVQEAGFQRKYSNVWMFYNGEKPQLLLPDGLCIKRVENDEEMIVMVDLFNRAHSGAADEVYGKLPPEYGEALRNFDPKHFSDKSITHYIGIMNGIPAAYATLINHGEFGGIYNIGTIPEFRRKGIGSALTLNAVEDAFDQKSKYIFLITEEGSSNERLYSQIGFTTEFVGDGYVLDPIQEVKP